MNFKSRPEQIEHFSAQLVSSHRITLEGAPEEVRYLAFRTLNRPLTLKVGQSVRVLIPLPHGTGYHARFYSITDPRQKGDDCSEFGLFVRRCYYINEFDGGEYKGVASNYLCELQPGTVIAFEGPFGLPFSVPANKSSDLLMLGMGTGIAPFRAFIRHIHENEGRWTGAVRLFYGSRTGLELLYMNDENSDLGNYYDLETFKAFQAVNSSPRFATPVALDRPNEQNAAEIWAMLQSPNTHVFVAGVESMLVLLEKALTDIAGSAEAWSRQKRAAISSGRWSEILY